MMLRVIEHAAASDVGRMRRANEDSYFVRSPLFVVADGMGGAQAGEVASRIAAEAFAEGLDESLAPERRLAAIVHDANRRIHDRSITDPSLHGMGTTLTAALLGDDHLTIAHVGDSRVYRLRDGELTRLTADHSLVGEMVRRGAISEAEAEQHPQRSILTRALGPESEVEVDTVSYGVRDGDVYLLCSDGLTTMLDDAEIAEIAGSGATMKEIAERLIARANEAGGVDNITVVVFRVGGGGLASGAQTSGAGSKDALHTAISEPVAAPAVETRGAKPRRPDDAPVAPDAAEPPPERARRPRRAETAAAGNGEIRPRLIQPDSLARARQRGRRRFWLGVGLAVLVFSLAAIGAVVGSLNVYFLGVDEHGLVTVYRGLPYDGPLGLQLYTKEYVSTTPASMLDSSRRLTLLDHTLRTRSDAIDLITKVEQGELAPDGGEGKPGSTTAGGS